VRALGEFTGEETHVLTIPEMPAHTHNTSFFIPNLAVLSSGGGFPPTELGATPTSSTGGGGAHNNMPPTTFYIFYIKL
jgi:microcystin-dependent protein